MRDRVPAVVPGLALALGSLATLRLLGWTFMGEISARVDRLVLELDLDMEMATDLDLAIRLFLK
jgi:hypothetical protein